MSEESTTGLGGEFADIEALLRELEPADVELHEPPDDIWTGISATVSNHELGTTPITTLSTRRNLRRPLLAVAAAVVLLVAGSVIISSRDRADDVLATAVLAYDPVAFDPLGSGTSAEVSLVDESSGLVITIDDATLPNDLGTDADLELWLIEADQGGNVVDLVSLGALDPAVDTTFAVPTGYDTSVYAVVDISIEPRDGDPTHSGRSILRGVLATT